MKKINPFLLLILLTCLVLPFGCKKDEEAPVDKEVLLAGTTSKKWKLTAATATVATLNIDIFATNPYFTLPTCKQDDIFTFSADKTYKTEEGANPCSPATTDKGTWALNADKTILTLTSTGTASLPYSGIPITISFSGNTMQGQASNVPLNVSGITISAGANFTFTAQ